ncbi:chitinase 2-like [Typha latifolia]|uniref:chitinase 2-like n=1 Tax=Typha latifolia TaxID=4733 RepID=UPI003C2B074C
MESNSKFLRSSFLLFQLLALLLPTSLAQNSNVYQEYIGALFKNVKFTDVPINPNVDFRFILAFAIDYTTSTSPPSPTEGQFGIFWDSNNLSPADVAAIKQNNGNVKVALSLGGSTISDSPVLFTASSVDSWVGNAVSSLTSIIQQYNLDGIDVNYEQFQSDPDTFAECIGQLISTLKNSGVISYASIAPFDSADVQSHYQTLWSKYGSVIDFVNFQFYAYDSSTTVSQFLGYYDTQSANYNGGKVLAGFTTGTDRGLTPANGFFDACSSLKSQGKLPGIFAWTADDSAGNGFQYEQQAQDLLAS